jgi:hypothetical protein
MKRTAAAVLLCSSILAGCGGKSSSPTTTVAPIGQSAKPVATTQAGLRRLAAQLGHPIYWLGPQANRTYELTRTTDDRIFVRYLPHDVPVGIRQALFTIVGTYPVPNALHVLRQLAGKAGEKSFSAPKHGFAVFNRAHPTNVYLAYPGSNLEIEVFDPSLARARTLVASGRVVPVG